ncbi:MAG TPA: alpha/beta hydrolase, partial [Microbacteriaceae bacterium]|nr:alpha/beta hydrolase [Microbacteriaceae bacterium]
ERGLPNVWLLGWSFGTELILKYGRELPDVRGFILLSPPLYRVTAEELARWRGDSRPLRAFVPEFDSFLTPTQARSGFAPIGHIDIVPFAECKHLWVGETQARQVIDAVAETVVPGSSPLPTEWSD